jgi:hypothetical protein
MIQYYLILVTEIGVKEKNDGSDARSTSKLRGHARECSTRPNFGHQRSYDMYRVIPAKFRHP